MTLPPVPWARHLWLSAATGGAAALGWWVALYIVQTLAVPSFWVGPLWLALVVGSSVGAALIADAVGTGREPVRAALWVALCGPAAAGTVAVGTAVSVALVDLVARGTVLDQDGLVSLRGQLLAFVTAGSAAGCWLGAGRLLPRLARRWWPDLEVADDAPWPIRLAEHVAAGAVAGGAWAAVWFAFGVYGGLGGDLFAGAALGSTIFGLLLGLLAGNAPRRAWAPWLRVRRGARAGTRVPLVDEAGRPLERFVGHFPRGLDLFLPFETGAAEVHVSVTVDALGDVVVRGHSVAPTVLKRFLETVDLAYDPRAPAPVEAVIAPGEIVRVGDVELEVLYLPWAGTS
jgi:hypothetical protein